ILRGRGTTSIADRLLADLTLSIYCNFPESHVRLLELAGAFPPGYLAPRLRDRIARHGVATDRCNGGGLTRGWVSRDRRRLHATICLRERPSRSLAPEADRRRAARAADDHIAVIPGDTVLSLDPSSACTGFSSATARSRVRGRPVAYGELAGDMAEKALH